MTWRPLLPLLLVPALSACQDQGAREQNAALTRRVEVLERQLGALQRREEAAAPDAGRVTVQAAAQNCANSLTRSLETFRLNSIDRRYPTPAQLELPDACADQRVNWLTRESVRYTFTVTGPDGRELARQSSQSGS